MNNDFRILVEKYSKDNNLLSSEIFTELDRSLPAKKTLDHIDLKLRDKSVRKIVIRKLSDYKEGDIF